MTRPHHINPLQWTDAVGVARQTCARIFRNGGSPGHALAAFGIDHDRLPATPAGGSPDWSKAVETIAAALCRTGLRKAA